MVRSEVDAPRRLPTALIERHPNLIPETYSDAHTLLVTFGFHCNLACVFCMVEDVLGVYRGATLEAFKAVLENRNTMAKIRRVTLSGGEATLERDVLEYVRLARSHPNVEHVRIQTNATRLTNRNLLQDLIAAGVDEFFVSIHGPDAAICDQLTAKQGSFRAIMAGVEAIAQSSATLLTNTAIVAPNHDRLRDIVELLAEYQPRTMDFWSIWPRIDQDDSRGLFVRVGDVRSHLLQALEACEQRGIIPVVKWFPHCLLGRFAGYHDDSQPTVLVEQTYWEKAPAFACIYEGICSQAPHRCAGLTFPYIRKFGWEEDVLEPSRGLAKATVNEGESRQGGPKNPGDAVVSRLALTGEMNFAGFRVQSVRAHQRAIIISLVSTDGHEIRVRLYEPDPARRCYARTNHFDVVHEALPDALIGRTDAPLQSLLAYLRQVNLDGIV